MEQKKIITVFGATGKIGTALLGYLSAAGVPVVAVTRYKGKAIEWPHVTWIEADMANKAGLYKTMENSRAVFLSSSVGPGFVDEQQKVIQVAKDCGVAHIVKLSSGAVDKSSPFYIPDSNIGKLHGAVEDFLKVSTINWTLLQPNGFMQNWLGEFSERVKTTGRIEEATGDGRRAYLDVRDIAEVAAAVLTKPAAHYGRTYLLTGGTAVNFAEIAAIISRVTKKQVTYIPLSDEEARERMARKGLPQWLIHSYLSYAALQRSGQAAYVSDAVPAVLQQPARTVETFINDHITSFS